VWWQAFTPLNVGAVRFWRQVRARHPLPGMPNRYLNQRWEPASKAVTKYRWNAMNTMSGMIIDRKK
jgi:hypothetical protein